MSDHCDSITTVVFDAVGTLIFPEPGVSAAYEQAGRRYGSSRTLHEIDRHFRVVFSEMEARALCGDLRTSEELEQARWREIVARVLDDVSDAEACFAELFAHFARPSSWRVFSDALRVLPSLCSEEFKLAIASNFDSRLLGIASELKPLEHCTDVLVSSAIGYRKPHRRFFEAVLDRVGERAEQILYVGDDPSNDLEAARAVGIRSLLLNRDGDQGTDRVNSLDAVAERIRRSVLRPA
jgi:putative hydrolase of the HAD superfamily